jgi:hypothetical protein
MIDCFHILSQLGESAVLVKEGQTGEDIRKNIFEYVRHPEWDGGLEKIPRKGIFLNHALAAGN